MARILRNTVLASGVLLAAVLLVYLLTPSSFEFQRDSDEPPEVDRRATYLKGHLTCVFSLAFSPDGRILASGSGIDNTVRLWDVHAAKELVSWPTEADTYGLTFDSAGAHLVAACYNATVREWNVVERLLKSELRIKVRTGVAGIALSSDDSRLAVAGGSSNSEVLIFDWRTKQQLGSLPGHPGGVDVVAYSPDGRRLSSAGTDRTSRVWDTASGLELQAFRRENRTVNAIRYLPDGKAAIIGGSTLTVQDAATGEEQAIALPNGKSVTALDVSPDGQFLAWLSGGEPKRSGMLYLWNLDKGQLELSWAPHGSNGTALAYSPQGDYIATGCINSGTIKLWNLKKLLESARAEKQETSR